MIRRTFLATLLSVPSSALAISTGGKFDYPHKEEEGPTPTPLIPFEVGYVFGDDLEPCVIEVFRVDTAKGEASFQFSHRLTRTRLLLGCYLKSADDKLLGVEGIDDEVGGCRVTAGNKVSLTMIMDLKTGTIIKQPTKAQARAHACLDYGQMI